MTMHHLERLLRAFIFILTALGHSPDVNVTINFYQAPPPAVAIDQAAAPRL